MFALCPHFCLLWQLIGYCTPSLQNSAPCRGGYGIAEHMPTLQRARHPARDTVVVESLTPYKHTPYRGNLPHIPQAKIRVESRTLIEHIAHILHIGHIPSGEIGIEDLTPVEHPIHRGYPSHIPLGDIRIEGPAIVEQLIHICHLRHIPSGDI